MVLSFSGLINYVFIRAIPRIILTMVRFFLGLDLTISIFILNRREFEILDLLLAWLFFCFLFLFVFRMGRQFLLYLYGTDARVSGDESMRDILTVLHVFFVRLRESRGLLARLFRNTLQFLLQSLELLNSLVQRFHSNFKLNRQ